MSPCRLSGFDIQVDGRDTVDQVFLKGLPPASP